VVTVSVVHDDRRDSASDSIGALQLLAEAAGAVHGPDGPDEKLAWFVEAARSLTGASVATYIDIRGVAGGSSVAAGVEASVVERLARPAVIDLLGVQRADVLLTEPLLTDPLLTDPRFRSFLDRSDLGPAPECILVPVQAYDESLHGVLLIGRRQATLFDAAEEAALDALAAHVGIAIDNFETVNRLTELQAVQREVVHQLQEAVRPQLPTVDAAEIGVYYLPADPSAPTGGDLYDCVVLPNGDLHLAVVDVMGKGVAATKDAVSVTHALRLMALDGCPMRDLVARAAALVSAQAPDLVATVLVVRYSPAEGVAHVAGGGHPPALVVSVDGDVRWVEAPGVAMGWPGAGSTGVTTVALQRSDTLVLYTDGLIEASKDILVGLDGIKAAAAETARYPAPHLARALVERALSGAMRRDDSLALVLRRRSPPRPDRAPVLAPFEYRFSPNPATVPLARHLFADWLEHLAVDDSERSDLILVASELCSNALRHSTGAPGALSLRSWADGDAVVVEVEDDGDGFELDDHYDDEIPDLYGEQGRGLYVVEALTDEMSVSRSDDHTVVRAVRRAVLPTP
jgi:serine phosphatase RsbU (regulator of sigma subunit)/anti-sigma regulatory factor (Ser/Thr protein kinase)